jgi:hypothetical protein
MPAEPEAGADANFHRLLLPTDHRRDERQHGARRARQAPREHSGGDQAGELGDPRLIPNPST